MKKYLLLLVPVLLLLGSVQMANASSFTLWDAWVENGIHYNYTVVYDAVKPNSYSWLSAEAAAKQMGGDLGGESVGERALIITKLFPGAGITSGQYAIAYGETANSYGTGYWANAITPSGNIVGFQKDADKIAEGFVSRSVPDASIMLLLGPSLLGLGLLARRKFEK
jgi:hypothetical protein